MSTTARASLAMALMIIACGAGSVSAESFTTSQAGLLGGVEQLALRALGHLPESGALLLWGTGLAAASRALSRKPDANK